MLNSEAEYATSFFMRNVLVLILAIDAHVEWEILISVIPAARAVIFNYNIFLVKNQVWLLT
jgi:hypothetical protein